MNYFGASVNQSPVIAERAGEDIKNGAFLAVKYDDDGNIVLCNKAGEAAFGLLLPDTAEEISEGNELTVQIKDIGLAKAGGAFKKGVPLTTDAQGKLVEAAGGSFILGYALEQSFAEGQFVRMDITKSGFNTAVKA